MEVALQLKTLDLALKEMPRKNRQAFLRTLKVIEFYWPPCCAFIVDMYKRAREYVYFGSQTWGGEPNPDYNPDLAAQLLIGYTRLFKDLLEDLKGKAKSTAVAMILDATNPIEFVELSQLRVNAAAYWSPRSQAVNWVKMLENDPELTFTAVFHMVGVISRGSEGVFPPGYENTEWLGVNGRQLAVALLLYYAHSFGATMGSRAREAQPMAAKDNLETMFNHLVQALTLSSTEKSHVEGAASSAVQGMAAATTPEDIMAQLHKLEELGVRLLDPVDNKVVATAMAVSFSKDAMDRAQADEVLLWTAKINAMWDLVIRTNIPPPPPPEPAAAAEEAAAAE